MAKKAKVIKNMQRQEMVKRYSDRRFKLKTIIIKILFIIYVKNQRFPQIMWVLLV